MIEEYKKITETPFLQWLSTNELAPSLYLARDTAFEGHFFVEALGKEHGGLLLRLAYCIQKGSEGRGETNLRLHKQRDVEVDCIPPHNVVFVD